MLEAQNFTPIGSSEDTEALEGGALETSMAAGHSRGKPIDLTVRPKDDIYPFCIVWTPIPPITIFLPFVGHMGITDSRGVIYDFQGPYTVGEGNLAFGRTARYLQLVKHADSEYAEEWDAAVRTANRIYEGRFHNLCWDNCHSHVKNALNRLRYGNFAYWNMGILAAWIFFQGKFVRFTYAVLPTVVLYTVIFCFAYLA